MYLDRYHRFSDAWTIKDCQSLRASPAALPNAPRLDSSTAGVCLIPSHPSPRKVFLQSPWVESVLDGISYTVSCQLLSGYGEMQLRIREIHYLQMEKLELEPMASSGAAFL